MTLLGLLVPTLCVCSAHVRVRGPGALLRGCTLEPPAIFEGGEGGGGGGARGGGIHYRIAWRRWFGGGPQNIRRHILEAGDFAGATRKGVQKRTEHRTRPLSCLEQPRHLDPGAELLVSGILVCWEQGILVCWEQGNHRAATKGPSPFSPFSSKLSTEATPDKNNPGGQAQPARRTAAARGWGQRGHTLGRREKAVGRRPPWRSRKPRASLAARFQKDVRDFLLAG